jgi:hypothetical protein
VRTNRTAALGTAGTVVDADGRRCLRGTQFDLDVANDYAFDVDETVTLELDVHSPRGEPLLVAYDKSGGFGHELVRLPDRGGEAKHLRIAPAAGTDYPYLDHPGAVRG